MRTGSRAQKAAPGVARPRVGLSSLGSAAPWAGRSWGDCLPPSTQPQALLPLGVGPSRGSRARGHPEDRTMACLRPGHTDSGCARPAPSRTHTQCMHASPHPPRQPCRLLTRTASAVPSSSSVSSRALLSARPKKCAAGIIFPSSSWMFFTSSCDGRAVSAPEPSCGRHVLTPIVP